MSDGYESDSERNLDDIDFEEFLNENGDLPERPSRESTRRRLITIIGDRGDTAAPNKEQAGAEKSEVEQTNPNQQHTDPANTGSSSAGQASTGPATSGQPYAGQTTAGAGAKSPDATSPAAASPAAGSPAPGTTRPDPGRMTQRMAPSTGQKLTVAFQGEAGAYSEQALHNYFGPDAVSLPCTDFRGIFDAIHSGKAKQGILPVENSLAGTVSAAYDQLVDHDLRIQGEAILRVEHCLMAPAGLKLGEIKQVKSHPQALAQCQQTLRRLGIQAIVHYDTAGAARDLAAKPEPGTAAIASALAAKTYGLEILARHVEDEPLNYTRFFLLGLDDPPRKDPSKTSVIFTTRHRPGALHQVLAELAQRNINLTKIESRPRRNRPWHYVFYMDFEGHEDQREVREALLGILKQASFLKVLGSYPAAEMPAGEPSFEPNF